MDGRISNPHNQAKNNLQASEADPLYAESSRIVGEAFMRSEPFRNFAFPRHVAPPLLARYEVGMTYGAHADTSHMRFGNEIRRSDLSATVWLNPPASYDGGELVVHLGTKPVVIKGEPGSVVVYPSTQLHEVTPVRRGQRLVSITFIESMIPDEFLRTQLYELQRGGGAGRPENELGQPGPAGSGAQQPAQVVGALNLSHLILIDNF